LLEPPALARSTLWRGIGRQSTRQQALIAGMEGRPLGGGEVWPAVRLRLLIAACIACRRPLRSFAHA
jgi:hypothetical protein